MTARLASPARRSRPTRRSWQSALRALALAVAAAIIATPILVAPAKASAEVFTGGENINYSGNQYVTYLAGFSQSFTATAPGTLSAEFWIASKNALTVSASVQRADSQGLPTGAVLGTLSGAMPGQETVYSPLYTTKLTGNVTVETGVKYAITFTTTTPGVWLQFSYGNPYPDGEASFTGNLQPGVDLRFATSIDAPSIVTPGMTGTEPSGTTFLPYDYTYAITGSPAPTVLVTDGTLPPGLTMSRTGTLSGTPTAAGTYFFRISVRNLSLSGLASNRSVTIQAARLPDAPRNLTARSTGTSTASVTFEAPLSSGDLPVSSYRVTSNPGGNTCSITANVLPRGCTIDGLSLDTRYTFTATATSAVGTGAASGPSNAVSRASVAPDAPAGIVAVSTAKTVATVTVTPPTAPSDRPITGYTVTSTDTTHSCTIDAASVPLSCDVTGLAIGDTYTFVATATSAAGTSPASVESNSIRRVPLTPDAPRTPTAAMVGKTSALVEFLAPAAESDRPITGYTVTSTPDGRTCETSTLSCTVEGLTIGTEYTFTVTATSLIGESGASEPSNAVLREPVAPDAPAGVTAVSSAKTVATVTVTPPVDASDRPITGYTVTSTTTADFCAITDVTLLPLSCDITGLTIGDTYAFVATATSVAGTSVNSAESNSILRAPLVPEAPAAVTAAVTDATTVAVGVEAPPYAGDRPLTSYTVTAEPDGLACTITAVDADPLGCSITGLTRGVSYTFTATATSSAGTSVASGASEAVIPSVLPLQAENVVVVPGDTELLLDWSAPLDDGGRPLGDYALSYRATGTDAWSRAVPVAGLTATITGLLNGTEYEVRLAASTPVGAGPETVVTATPFSFDPVLTLAGGAPLAGASVKRGDVITLADRNLPVGSVVTVELHSTPVTLATVTVGADGTFALPVTIPADTPAGAHSLVLTISGTGAADVLSSTSFTVVAPAPAASVVDSGLAGTGFAAGWLTWAGGAFLALGMLLLRTRRHQHS